MNKDPELYTFLITSYESHGKGAEYITNNLNKIISQTYRPIQVVVSDHSNDDNVENAIKAIDITGIDLVYKRFSEHYGSIAANWNNALTYAKGSLIQYLALDDYLADNNSVKNVVEFFKNSSAQWIACSHRIDPSKEVFVPKWNSNILQGNSISGPSAIVLRESLKHIALDPDFNCFVDLDWYYRLYKIAGPPTIFNKVTWVNRHHEDQMSHTVCKGENVINEQKKLIKKYGYPLPSS